MTLAQHCTQPGCLLGSAFRCQKCHHEFCLTHNPEARHACLPELRWTWPEVAHPLATLEVRPGDRELIAHR
jgi:predicted nucleic acid binding AN1-type Zn finger protein